MSAKNLPRLARYMPLWKRPIPPYPLHYKGNPKNRVFLPMFWMKMVKHWSTLPNFMHKFEVHPQMTKVDVTNYLNKIYDVKVLDVRTDLERGDEWRTHPMTGDEIGPEPDRRVAYVTVDKKDEFDFPDIFKDLAAPEERQLESYRSAAKDAALDKKKSWQQQDVPSWFR
ncbi:hypothetical protein CAPTEDRAFT_186143 [Capitella teleta]|uniref:Large ribosomal subunit protein uL23m n=1 Tax=Capitella teleta TaxID=283909 RepID=R7UB50_CAPTE|nr:hypothetical protein CAPTEDRAFT_186143 [Capitella teleta]|eukprot:ELU03590.1 hypothetical protein CAPTEDRAFT_186143 [Capitella teleta]